MVSRACSLNSVSPTRWRLLDFMSAVPPPPPPPSPLRRRTSIASARSQCSPPDLEQQAQDQSVPRRTSSAAAIDHSVPRRTRTASSGSERSLSTASARSQCFPPDPNKELRIRAFPAGPQLQGLDRSVPRRTLNSKPKIRAFPTGPQVQAALDPRRTSSASARSQRSQPDPNSKLRIRVSPAGPQLQAIDRSVPPGPEQQAQDQSVPHRTSSASCARSPPDFKRKR